MGVLSLALLIGTIIFTGFVVALISKKYIELKYALLWFFTSVILIIIAVFHDIPKIIASLLSIKEVTNAVFLVAIGLLIVVTFSLTIALSRASNRITKLAQEVALLRKHNNDNK
jgi:hypothetical protein